MYRTIVSVFLFCLAPLATFAGSFCEHQNSLLETIADMQRSSAISLLGRPVVIIGRLDEEYQFTGNVFGAEGVAETVEVDIHTAPSPRFLRMISRVPPQYFGGPKPGEYFVGVLGGGPNPVFADDEQDPYTVYRSECTEGYVSDPTPEFLEQLRICIATGLCGQ